jgi:hypothetical protein
MQRNFEHRAAAATQVRASRATLQATSRRPPGTVEWLQRTFGNTAVQRMLGGVVLQRQIDQSFEQWLGDDEASLEALRLYLQKVVYPVYIQIPTPSDSLAKRYDDMWQSLYEDNAEVGAQTKLITELVSAVNTEHPSSKSITTPPSKAVVEEKKSATAAKKAVGSEKKSAVEPKQSAREKKQTATTSKRPGAEEKTSEIGAAAVKKQLADHFNKVWDHLAIGGNTKGRPIGYHTNCQAAQAVCKIPDKYKSKPIKTGELGTYKQWVIVKPKGSAKEPEPYDKDFSSFWPDDWTKQDIMDVCVSLPTFRFKFDMVVELEQTRSGKACAGLTVRLTEESFYPVID